MIPSSGTPIYITELLAGFLLNSRQETFIQRLKAEIGRSHGFLANSATTLVYLALKALRKSSERREVILPAYTAPLLILAIQKSGLIPKPCDISLETFQIDCGELQRCLTPQTLAVLAVHSFGIPAPMRSISELTRSNGSYLFEDAAVADGSRLDGQPAGSFGDVSVISFNRGKNMSTFAGGAAFTDDPTIADAIRAELETLPAPTLKRRLLIALQLGAVSFAARPWVYTLMYSQISKFKDVSLHDDFEMFRYTNFQAGVGCSLMKRRQAIFSRRAENGRYLQETLADIPGIRLPAIPDDAEPVFNQFPILMENTSIRDRLCHRIISESRVESTILYPKPVHLCYNLAVPKDAYPNASYLAPRLLLIPTHPFITRKRLESVVSVVRNLIRHE